jgi:hypothetical protein
MMAGNNDWDNDDNRGTTRMRVARTAMVNMAMTQQAEIGSDRTGTAEDDKKQGCKDNKEKDRATTSMTMGQVGQDK